MAKSSFGNIVSSIGSAMSGVASSIGSSAGNKNSGSSSSSSRPSSGGSSSSGSSSSNGSTGIAGSIADAIKDKLNSGGSKPSGGGNYVNVAPGGNAPAGTQIGDIVITAGGNYKVVAPGTAGATYNPSSGLWSVKVSGSGASGGGSNGYNPMGNYFDSGLSQNDKKAIANLQKAWEDAMAKGDTVGASQYHQWAQDIRKKYGYSGGADGSMYIPLEMEEDKLPSIGLPVYEPQID